MNPARAALLVIDVQRGFDDPFWGPRNNLDAEANIARIIAAWRESGRPVFHILHDSTSASSPLHAGQAGNLPKPEAEPHGDEPVYRKAVNSAFIGTSLEANLRNARIDTLVTVGLTTNHCVSTTVRMAGNLGFQTYLVSDATATFDRLGIDGRTRPAAEVHAAALSDLQDEFATLIRTEEMIASLSGFNTANGVQG
jgi:nicotinamidase-related amidase